MKFMFIIAIVLGTISSKTSPGKCPSTTQVKNFNADAYLGRWYEFRRDAGTPYEWMADCVTATYGLKENGNVRVANRAWYWWFFFSYYEIVGEANCNASGERGACYVNFDQSENKDMNKDKNYLILDTDYYNYAVVYSCFERNSNKIEDFWILTREPVPSSSDQTKYKDLAKSLVPEYDHDYVIYTKQGDTCKYE